ncbi:MAG: hypothetical protein ACOYN8_11095 [Pseudanabaena sp.]|jgi:hypothetical protein
MNDIDITLCPAPNPVKVDWQDKFEPIRGRLSIEDLVLVNAMLEVKDEKPLSLQEAITEMETK